MKIFDAFSQQSWIVGNYVQPSYVTKFKTIENDRSPLPTDILIKYHKNVSTKLPSEQIYIYTYVWSNACKLVQADNSSCAAVHM